jgi:hypothetical protein
VEDLGRQRDQITAQLGQLREMLGGLANIGGAAVPAAATDTKSDSGSGSDSKKPDDSTQRIPATSGH